MKIFMNSLLVTTVLIFNSMPSHAMSEEDIWSASQRLYRAPAPSSNLDLEWAQSILPNPTGAVLAIGEDRAYQSIRDTFLQYHAQNPNTMERLHRLDESEQSVDSAYCLHTAYCILQNSEQIERYREIQRKRQAQADKTDQTECKRVLGELQKTFSPEQIQPWIQEMKSRLGPDYK